MQILEHVPNGCVNITGMAGNELANLKLAQTASLVNTMEGSPIIVIMLQCANYGVGQMVHSKGQMEHFGVVRTKVDAPGVEPRTYPTVAQ